MIAFPTENVLSALIQNNTEPQPRRWPGDGFSFYSLPRLSIADGLAKLQLWAPAWQRGDLARYGGVVVRLVRPLPPNNVKLPYGHALYGQEIPVGGWVIAHVLDARWPNGSAWTFDLEIIPGTESVFEARAATAITEETYAGAPAVNGIYVPGWEAYRDAPGAGDEYAAIDQAERKALYDRRHAIAGGPHHIQMIYRITKRTKDLRGEAVYIDGFLALKAREEITFAQLADFLLEHYGITSEANGDTTVIEILGRLATLGWCVPGWRSAFGRSWTEESYDLEFDYD